MLKIISDDHDRMFSLPMFQQRRSKCEQPKMNSVPRSHISVEVLQQLSKARPPGVHFLSASLQQLAEMSCLRRGKCSVSSPPNPAAPHPPSTNSTTSPPSSVTLRTGQPFQYIPHPILPLTNWKPGVSLCFSVMIFFFPFFAYPLFFLLPSVSAAPIFSVISKWKTDSKLTPRLSVWQRNETVTYETKRALYIGSSACKRGTEKLEALL